MDPAGTALLATAVLALLIPLTEGRALGWPLWSWLLLALFAPALAGFVFVERRLERTDGHPIVPPSLLRLPGMRRGLVIAVPFFGGFGAFMFVSAISFQQGAHFSALRGGFALAPLAATFLIASLLTARLTARYGRNVLVAGGVLHGVGLLSLAGTILAAWPHVDPVNLAPAMAIAGIGQGLVVSPLFGFVLGGVPAARAGVGSGIVSTTMQVSLALGIASLGSLFLSLSSTGSLGVRDAFVVVLAVQAAAAVLVAVAARTLPMTAPASREQERVAATPTADSALAIENAAA